jgi:CDP-glycerol glycerophosphotransferase
MGFIKQLFGLIVYKIAPIKRNRFVFTSFGGHYSDNTKAISEKLHEMDSSAEIVWLISENYKSDLPEYVRAVDINSFSIYWYRGSAAAQIDNVYGFRAFFLTNDSFSSKLKSFVWRTLSYKKNQPIYVTMHGTPLKKIGRDQIGNVILGMSCPNTYMLVGDQLSADVFERVTFGTMPITVIGAPRNDALFLENSSAKKKLGLPIDKKILLFAPTFRNDGIDVEGKNIQRSGLDQLSAMDFEELFGTLNEKFG